MSTLTDRIAEVLRQHRFATAAWGQTHCWCQQNLAADDFGMNYERHDAHVAERIEAELQLREERGGIGDSTYDPRQRRWVSAWTEVDS